MPKKFQISLLLILVSLTGVAAVGCASASAKPSFGMADNTGGMLIDPRFQKSGLHRVRYIASYDAIAKRGRVLKAQDAWFKEAHAQGVEPLISFYRTSACSPQCAAKRLPTVKQYIASVKQYM